MRGTLEGKSESPLSSSLRRPPRRVTSPTQWVEGKHLKTLKTLFVSVLLVCFLYFCFLLFSFKNLVSLHRYFLRQALLAKSEFKPTAFNNSSLPKTSAKHPPHPPPLQSDLFLHNQTTWSTLYALIKVQFIHVQKIRLHDCLLHANQSFRAAFFLAHMLNSPHSLLPRALLLYQVIYFKQVSLGRAYAWFYIDGRF